MAKTTQQQDDLLHSVDLPFRKRVLQIQAFQIMVVLFVIILAFGAIKPANFLTVFNLQNIIVNTSIFAVLGVGMTFVIITAGIDLSVGSVLVFSSILASKTFVAFGGQGWGATIGGIVVSLVVGTLWGIVNGFLIAYAKVPAFIVTLGTLGAALGFSQIITGGIDIRVVPDVFVNAIGFGKLFGAIPALAIIAVFVLVIGGVALHKTKFGLITYAVGSNPEGCRRVGIRVNRHLMYIYALMGFLAGLAGVLSLAFYETTTIAGQSQTNLTIIAGVVIGGTSLFGGYGSIFGSIVGLLIPIVLQNGFIIIGVVPYWQNVVVGVFLVAAVYVDTARREAADSGISRFKKRSQIGSESQKGKK
jgi:ribose transport system permease protein